MPMTPPNLEELMDGAEAEISACLKACPPATAASKLLAHYRALQAPVERETFVAALALRLAVGRSGSGPAA